MLKDNHLAWSGGVEAAIMAVRAAWPTQVIVEAETEAQAMAAVAAGANGVLLDEFRPQALSELVPRLRQQAAAAGAVVLPAPAFRRVAGLCGHRWISVWVTIRLSMRARSTHLPWALR